MIPTKSNKKALNDKLVQAMMGQLTYIYDNKSSDEYKMAGDITALSTYQQIEYNLASLDTVKGIDKKEASNMRTMFNTLHRPFWKKHVAGFINDKSEANVLHTTFFTVGYRIIVGELARIDASTVATTTGMVYKPDKISKKESLQKIISAYNDTLEANMNKVIRDNIANNKNGVVQEAAVVDAAVNVIGIGVNTLASIFTIAGNIFASAEQLNPISLMNACLTKSYDKKVAKYSKICDEYEETKKAYEEYMKIPKERRKEKVEHKYVKMMEKYNIKMGNAKAKLDHFDSRSKVEAEDKVKAIKTESSSTEKKNDTKPSESSSDNDLDF